MAGVNGGWLEGVAGALISFIHWSWACLSAQLHPTSGDFCNISCEVSESLSGLIVGQYGVEGAPVGSKAAVASTAGVASKAGGGSCVGVACLVVVFAGFDCSFEVAGLPLPRPLPFVLVLPLPRPLPFVLALFFALVIQVLVAGGVGVPSIALGNKVKQ